MKKRLDQLLLERELADSITKAQSLILSGNVLVNEQREDKSGKQFEENVSIRIKNVEGPYVGRGGLKLEHALDFFKINPAGKVCMDVGASTGGFTDCLLQRQAKKVYAVDVGYGQLDWKIRNDPRVVVLERENIRRLSRETIPDPIDLAVIDVSFISLKLVFPIVQKFLPPSPHPPPIQGGGGGMVIALVKPQFEVKKERVGKKGVVTDEKLQEETVTTIQKAGESLGWKWNGSTPSPILGAEGNREFLITFSTTRCLALTGHGENESDWTKIDQ